MRSSISGVSRRNLGAAAVIAVALTPTPDCRRPARTRDSGESVPSSSGGGLVGVSWPGADCARPAYLQGKLSRGSVTDRIVTPFNCSLLLHSWSSSAVRESSVKSWTRICRNSGSSLRASIQSSWYCQ